MASITGLTEVLGAIETVKLESSDDWFEWYIQCKYQARWRGIWSTIDPDAPDSDAVSTQAPLPPTYDHIQRVEVDRRLQEYEERMEAWEALDEATRGREPTAPTVPTRKEIEAKYDDERKDYLVRSSDWSARSTRNTAMWNWITKSVNSAILTSVLTELELLHPDHEPSLQRVLRLLKKRYAPSDDSVFHTIRTQYIQALSTNVTRHPEKWLTQWEGAFVKARAKNIPEIQGQLGTEQFLLAIKEFDPAWASQQLSELARAEALGLERIPLEDLARWYSVRLRQEASHRSTPKHFGGQYAVIALKECPCGDKHYWAPQACRRLKYAISGGKDVELRDPPSPEKCKEIRAIYSSNRWKQLKARMEASDRTDGDLVGLVDQSMTF